MASFSIWKRAKDEHYEDNHIFDVIFLGIFGGIVGARLFYILFNFPDFGFRIGRWFNLAYSNQFSWLGFLLGFIYVVKIFAKKKKWDFFKFADLSVFGIIIAQVFIRFGQFLDGSYVGTQTNLPIGLNFPGIVGARHALSLYEIPIFVIAYFLIRWFDRHYRLFSWYQGDRGEARSGFLWQTYLTIYTSLQFFLDFLYERKTIFWIFSLRQILLFIVLFIIIIVFWMRAGNEFDLDKIKEKFFKEVDESQPIRPTHKPLESRERPKRFLRAKAGKDAK
jgi:phosphatidylglycerol---prolipoprotein diacylglyceryl transferase